MPSLPLDLERLIFEIAALQETDHNSRVRLLLVAKRVYAWIRPILYRVVAIVKRPYGPQNTPGTLTIHNYWPNAQPVLNSAQFVRHFLTLTNNISHLLEMLSTFPNIENLAVWSPTSLCPEFFEKMNNLPLRMLSIDMAAVTEYFSAFKNITHLETFDLHRSTWEDDHFKVLVELPKLTHVCLDYFLNVKDAIILHLLEHCASLRVFILLAGTQARVDRAPLNDPRCFVLLVEMDTNSLMDEWERSANGFIGRWEVAEFIIEARKSNFFQDESSFIFSRMTWMDHLNDDGMRWYESRGLRNDV